MINILEAPIWICTKWLPPTYPINFEKRVKALLYKEYIITEISEFNKSDNNTEPLGDDSNIPKSFQLSPFKNFIIYIEIEINRENFCKLKKLMKYNISFFNLQKSYYITFQKMFHYLYRILLLFLHSIDQHNKKIHIYF